MRQLAIYISRMRKNKQTPLGEWMRLKKSQTTKKLTRQSNTEHPNEGESEVSPEETEGLE